MAASGPGVINLATGMANALIDCAPVIACGGSSSIMEYGKQTFQEIDQMAIMRGCTKWSQQVLNVSRIPQIVNTAFQKSMAGKPGPVYLDFPGDILYQKVPEESLDWGLSGRALLRPRPQGEPAMVNKLIDALSKAKQPIVLTGSGVIWSQAWTELQEFVEKAGIPFYTTPQGRGVVPDDHALSFLAMRSSAFKEADLILFGRIENAQLKVLDGTTDLIVVSANALWVLENTGSAAAPAKKASAPAAAPAGGRAGSTRRCRDDRSGRP